MIFLSFLVIKESSRYRREKLIKQTVHDESEVR